MNYHYNARNNQPLPFWARLFQTKPSYLIYLTHLDIVLPRMATFSS